MMFNEVYEGRMTGEKYEKIRPRRKQEKGELTSFGLHTVLSNMYKNTAGSWTTFNMRSANLSKTQKKLYIKLNLTT